MDIEQKKKEEIKLILKDALEIKAEMQKIMQQTAKVSAKFSQIGDSIISLSSNISKISKQLGNKGDAITSGAMLVGGAVKFGSNLWGKYKQNKLNEQMLPKKKEIANAKIDVIKKLKTRVVKKHNQLEIFCTQEAKVIQDTNSVNYNLLQEGTKELLDTYFVFKHLLHICNFFIAEFEAWLSNSHENNYIMIPATVIYQDCVNQVIENSNFPEKNIQNKVSFGAVLSLSDEKVSRYAIQNEKITEYTKIISKNRIQNIALFFTKNAKEFNSFYSKYLKQNDYIKYSTIFYYLKPLLLILFTFGIGTATYFWFDSIFWTVISVIFGAGLFYLTTKIFQKYLSDIKDKAIFDITGHDKIKNQTILKKFNRNRLIKLLLAVIIDALGMVTYLIDVATGGAGELVDIFWAPFSAILIFALFKERFGIGMMGAFFGLGEEISPFDFIPTASITWFTVYIAQKNKTLAKMGYKEKEDDQEIL